ncbi:Phosphatidylinositol 4-phosphate 5-kinase 2 [Cucumispora dikerogammari]|nr:Phosphatidylinositol 4-phosphate 5-kinase 2 [Cucumispora dikerogammari]
MIDSDTIFKSINSAEKTLQGDFSKFSCQKCGRLTMRLEEETHCLNKKKTLSLEYTLKIEMILPDDFISFREQNGITDLHRSFLCEEYMIQQTGSKQQEIYLTRDCKYVVKEVTKSELNTFLRISGAYFDYFNKAPFTRICKIFGAYSISVYKKAQQHSCVRVIVMENVVNRNNLSKIYDLKGSTLGRYSLPSQLVLKDNNWIQDNMKLHIPSADYMQLLVELNSDFEFLQANGLMDFSLIIGIYNEKPTDDNTYYKVITKCLPTCLNDVDKRKYRLLSESCYSLNMNKKGETNYKLYYNLGIVDILTEYDCNKKMESCFKSVFCLKGRSCCDPKKYKKRLLEFLKKRVN